MAITAKQEKFALLIFEGKTRAEAYRGAYDAVNSNDATCHKRGTELVMKGAIAGRIQELRAKAEPAHLMSLEEHLQDLKMLRNAAVNNGQYGAAISAEVARGRAYGLYTEKIEHTGKNGQPLQGGTFILPGVMTPEEWEKAAIEHQNQLQAKAAVELTKPTLQ
jgi:phage terminase small subunit